MCSSLKFSSTSATLCAVNKPLKRRFETCETGGITRNKRISNLPPFFSLFSATIDSFMFFNFQGLIKTSKRISVVTAGKNALRLGNLPSLKVIYVQSERRYRTTRSRNFTDVCIVGSTNLAPPEGLNVF